MNHTTVVSISLTFLILISLMSGGVMSPEHVEHPDTSQKYPVEGCDEQRDEKSSDRSPETKPEEGLSEFEIKKKLVDEFDPGTCYGMPKVVSDEVVESTLERNQELAEKIKSEYGFETKTKTYSKVLQFVGIQLTQETDSSYAFSFRDGECCRITTVEGIYSTQDGITVQNESIESVPC